MARELDLPLPELTSSGRREDFERAWTRFELVAAAKEWDEEKQVTIIPTLLRGNLVDAYVELEDEVKGDLGQLKLSLMKRAGFEADPLIAEKKFMARIQQEGEKVSDYAAALKRLFKEAYAKEDASRSDVLLQRFLMGLLPAVSRQLLVRGTPESLEDAIKDATEVEYGLRFGLDRVPQSQKIDATIDKGACCNIQEGSKLQETMESIVKRLESLESRITNSNRPQRHNQKCWTCGEEGHLQRNCPLNEQGPDQQVGWLARAQQIEAHPQHNNFSFMVAGFIGPCPSRFLLDTGATMSVVRWSALPEELKGEIVPTGSQATGASGLPLEIIGQVNLEVSIGRITCQQKFIVANTLAVECVLGSDFLCAQGAVINCHERTLSLAEGQWTTPVGDGMEQSLKVCAAVDVEVPSNTVQLMLGRVEKDNLVLHEGLFEPKLGSNVPNHICVARSLNNVCSNNELTLQVMNTGPSSVTIRRGTILGSFTSSSLIAIVGSGASISEEMPFDVLSNIEQQCQHLMPQERKEVTDLLSSYKDLFVSKKGPLGRTDKVKHSIPTQGRPIRQPIRRTPESLRRAIEVETDAMLSSGVIRRSSSPWSSPVIMVQKKDGSWRFCVDYCRLNAVTHQDAYPLPRIDSTLDTLSGSSYFTTLDLASGYWQVEIEDSDKEKTAFSTRQGHFEFNVMPFGLTNAPATFQRLMECILAGLNMEQCLIYIDDIIIFGSSVGEHLRRLERVLSRLD